MQEPYSPQDFLAARTILLHCTDITYDPNKRIQQAGFDIVQHAFDYLGKQFDIAVKRRRIARAVQP